MSTIKLRQITPNKRQRLSYWFLKNILLIKHIFTIRIMESLKVKVWKRNYANTTPKKAGVAIPISGKVDFKTKILLEIET